MYFINIYFENESISYNLRILSEYEFLHIYSN